MEYIVSARKYRPLTFDTVVGQAALTSTLKNSVRTGKLAHAYLFCGPRGVGKTTCARIFAKVINCTNPTADGDACGECESCKSFEEQRSFNIFELDAASNNGVEHIKALMEQTRIPPQVGKYKVFIIDEVHMLSTQAFNAFLKTLEEPPSYVIFILATTEKHKLLPTIISRCQIYDFERMTVPNIIAHLKNVAEKEGIKYEEEALNVIAEKADGGMRDALSIFDQVASFCQGDITYEKVITDLNVLDSETYVQIIDMALENKVSEIMLLVNQTLAKGFDGGQLINGLSAHIRNLMLAKDERTADLLQASAAQKNKFMAQAQKCPTKFLYRSLRMLNNCDVNYRQSSNKRLLVELTLIEVAQITQPDDPASGRRPGMLKTIFKKLLKLAAKSGVQEVHVAKEAHDAQGVQREKTQEIPALAANRKEPQSSNSDSPSTATSAFDTSKIAAIHKQSINNAGINGFSFKSMKAAQEKLNAINQEEDKVVVIDKTFTQEQLATEWIAMCNRMSQRENTIALSARLRNVTPQITEFPQVEVAFSNNMLLNEVQSIKKRIEATLKQQLQNSGITLTLRKAAQEEVKHLLTPRQRYDELMEKNKAMKSLLQGLDMTIVS